MMTFLWNYKWELLAALLSSVATAFLTYTICSWHYNGEITRQATAAELKLEQSVTAERTACMKNQKVTEATSDELQKMLTDTNDRLAAINSLLPEATANGTSVPIAITPARHDDTAKANLPAVQVITPGDIAQCDRQTAQLIACQGFIRATWADHQYTAPR